MKPSKHTLPALLLACAASSAFAQTYPVKPIHMVVGFAPGGANDTIARILSPELNKALGQTVIVDNRPGAGGTVGRRRVPGYDFSSWYGVFATGGTSPDILERLAQEVRKAVALPQVQTQIATQGVETASGAPAEFRTFVGSEIAKWGKVVKAVGVKID